MRLIRLWKLTARLRLIRSGLAVSRLSKALKSPRCEIREAAAKALGELGSPLAIHCLVKTFPSFGDTHLDALNSIDPEWSRTEAAVQAAQTLVLDLRGGEAPHSGAIEVLVSIT